MVLLELIEHFKGSVLYFKGWNDVIILAMVFVVPIAVIAIMTFRYNRITYPERLREWDHRFMCQRCRVIFAP